MKLMACWLSITVVGCLADGRVCTEQYVEGGVQLVIRAPIDGRYHVVVEVAGEALALDFDRVSGSYACVAPCAAGGVAFSIDQGLGGGLSSDAMIVQVTNPSRTGGPPSLELQVDRGTAVVHGATVIAPAYDTTEPYGPGCGYVSKAIHELTIP